MATTLLSQSWACLTCGYTLPVGIDPFGDYFTQRMLFMSSHNGQPVTVNGCPEGLCPSCYYHPNSDQRAEVQLERITDLSRPDLLIQTTTVDQADIDAQTVTDLDENNNPIMVDSGEVTQQLDIVDGAPAVVDVPVMVEQTRPLTDEEKQERLDQAQQTLDAINPVVVSEVTPEAGQTA